MRKRRLGFESASVAAPRVNKLIAFLGNREKQRNEKEHDRSSRQQEFATYMLETE